MIEDIIFGLPNGLGLAIGLVVVFIWGIIELSKLIWTFLKKDQISMLKSDIEKSLANIEQIVKSHESEVNILRTEIELIKANYKSELRVQSEISEKLFKLEKEIFLGNGRESLTNRVSILENVTSSLKESNDLKYKRSK